MKILNRILLEFTIFFPYDSEYEKFASNKEIYR